MFHRNHPWLRFALGALPALVPLLAAWTTALAADSIPSGPELFKKIAPSVVTIVAYNPNRAMPGIGSGFFLAADRVATARHVLAGVDRAEIRTTSGKVVRIVGILAEDRSCDVAILKLAEAVEGAPIAELSPNVPEPGERVFTVSSPFGLEGTVSEGLISGIRILPGAGTSIQHTAAVSPGSSGCPLFHRDGRVIAMQTATITTGDGVVQAGQSLNFATPAERLTALVPGEPRALAPSAAEIGGGWVPPITREMDRFGLRPFTRDDFRSALPLFEDAVRREPGEADAWFRLGLCKDRIGDQDGALEAYRKAIELGPEHVVAHNNLGVVYLRKGLYPEAAEALRRAVALKDDYTEALTSLAKALNEIGRHDEAIGAAERAIRQDRNSAEAHFQLGIALLRAGRQSEALEQCEALRRLDNGLAEALKALVETRWSRAGDEAPRNSDAPIPPGPPERPPVRV